MVGRVWPTGLGTLPLRKHSAVCWNNFKILFVCLIHFLKKFFNSRLNGSHNDSFSCSWLLKLGLPAAIYCCS